MWTLGSTNSVCRYFLRTDTLVGSVCITVFGYFFQWALRSSRTPLPRSEGRTILNQRHSLLLNRLQDVCMTWFWWLTFLRWSRSGWLISSILIWVYPRKTGFVRRYRILRRTERPTQICFLDQLLWRQLLVFESNFALYRRILFPSKTFLLSLILLIRALLLG